MVGLWASAIMAQEPEGSRANYRTTNMPVAGVDRPFVRWGECILLEDVIVNGQGPYRFLLDTAAQGAGRIDEALAEILGLKSMGKSAGVGLLGRDLEMTRYRLESLAIGALTFLDVEVSSRDYNAEVPPGLGPIHGVLGYHLFEEYLLTIDYPGRRIRVSKGQLPPPDGEHVLPIVSDDGLPEIDVSVGGHTFRALIDTGAMSPLFVSGELAKKLEFRAPPVPRGKRPGIEMTFGTLVEPPVLGKIELADARVVVADPMARPLLGVQALTQLSLTFDQAQRRLRVERRPARPSYGLKIIPPRAGGPEYRGVDRDSIAERAGLRPSDRILAINGMPFESMNLEDIMKAFDSPRMRVRVERDGEEREVLMAIE